MFKFSPVSLLVPALFAGLLSTSIGLASNPALAPLASSRALTPEGTVIVHDARMRIVEGPVEVSEMAPEPAVTDAAGERDQASDLAQRFILALTTPTVTPAAKPRSRRTKTAQPNQVWTCGKWQALWQGRGQGRTCEFK